MDSGDQTLTTKEFSKRTGLSVATTTKLLRQGKLSGEKRRGRWAIPASELDRYPRTDGRVQEEPTATAAGVDKPSPASQSSYTIETFANITYLTEKGVRTWLKTGRLSGGLSADGSGTVDAANLSRPDLAHLIR